MKPLLIAMRGPADPDISEMSNFEAGITFLVLLNQLSPGLKWGEVADIATGETMAGWNLWRKAKNLGKDIGKSVGVVKDGIGDVLKDTWKETKSTAGAAIRLVTDENVIDGASRLGMAYATGGTSEAGRAAADSMGEAGGGLMDFISNLGATFKGKSGSAPMAQAGMMGIPSAVLPWALGGGLLLVLLVGKKG